MAVIQKQSLVNAPKRVGLSFEDAEAGKRTDKGEAIPQTSVGRMQGLGEQISVVPERPAKNELELEREQNAANDIVIEGFGSLNEAIKEPDYTEDEGEGPYVVVLHDNVTGVNKIDGHFRAKIYFMGDIARLSKFVPTYTNDKRDAAIQIRRLLTLEAIRMATTDEVATGKITVLQHSPEMVTAQQRIREQEKELEYYRTLMGDKDITGGTREKSGEGGQQSSQTLDESANGNPNDTNGLTGAAPNDKKDDTPF